MMTKILQRSFFLVLILLLSGCATFSNGFCCFYKKPGKTWRIATYNICVDNKNCYSCHGYDTTHLLSIMNADVVVLQETTHFWQRCMRRHLKKKYPYQIFHDCKCYGRPDGMGIISKYPITKAVFIPAKYGWFPACVYIVSLPGQKLQILNLHLRPPLISDNNIGFMGEALFTTPAVRRQEVRYFTKFLSPHYPTVIGGDFNEGDNGLASRFLKSCCYYDGLSMIHPAIKTWYWHVGPFTIFGRYDHLFVNNCFKFIKCQVLQEGCSDHYPVVLDLR